MMSKRFDCKLLLFGLSPLLNTGCPDCYSEAHPGSCAVLDAPPTTEDTAAPTAEGACDPLATEALAVLQDNCYLCHGQNGSIEGGFNFVMNPVRMADEGKLVPGDADRSRIYLRMSQGTMPPTYAPTKPSAADIAAVRAWIQDCEAVDPNAVARDFVDLDRVMKTLYDDIRAQDSADRPYIRYLSLVHLYNAGVSADELATYRGGLSKLVNHLSFGGKVVVPEPVAIDDATDDDDALLFRVNLADYAWEAGERRIVDGWEQVIKRYPYAFQYDDPSGNFAALQSTANSRMPVVNGDWFVAATSVSPLYEEVLGLPDNVDDFLALFDPDVRWWRPGDELDPKHAARAGFYQSGVSVNNRCFERQEAQDKYCWVSYDFASSTGHKNIFAHPLDFIPDGGEMFCALPNGLQAYFLSDAQGDFIPEGPINVVSDPNNSEGGYTVLNGRSCMNCHYAGVIDKEDEVRAFATGPGAYLFDADELELIDRLYGADILGLLDEDRLHFSAATALTGVADVYETEPVFALAADFDRPLTEARALAELWLDPSTADLEKILDTSGDEEVEASLYQIVSAGTVDREAFVPLVQRLLCLVNHQTSDCPVVAGSDCSSPDFDLDGDGALDVFGLPCLSGQVCVDEGVAAELSAKTGEDFSGELGACVDAGLL